MNMENKGERMKKLFFRLSLISILLFSCMGIGHALTLKYNFEGSFSDGNLEGQAFNGKFQYDTNKDPFAQNDYFEVTVAGISYVGAADIIVDNTNINGKINYQLNSFIDGELGLTFDQSLNPDLSQPLPLDLIISKQFVFSSIDRMEEGSGNFNLSLYAPVPEPATMLLFGTGLIGLAGLRRKLKK